MRSTCFRRWLAVEMTVQENWGVSLPRIREFFQSQRDVKKVRDNHFRFGRCEIFLTERSGGAVGPIPVPRTQVEFAGDERDTEEIRRRFHLRFLSAGG
ncbi:MAG: hypothetical protein IJV41_12440 [Oscillospiraceae bacterium]|nr:hypothetical protein [Oscillospiraceae bacterium]